MGALDPARKGRITASAVGAILCHSPHGTRESVMRRMVREWHGAEPEFTGNVATDYGNHHESGALVEYRMETGNAVQPGRFITREAWAGCTPDGLIGDRGGLEIKCPFSLRKPEPGATFKSLRDQPHYYDQVQFSLWVTGRQWWHFYQWAPGMTALEVVQPDYEWQEDAIPRLMAFYDEYLRERGQNAEEHLAPLRPRIYTPEAQRLVEEWDQLGEAIANAEARRKEILARMVEVAGEKDSIIAGRNLTRVTRAGAVKYAEALKELAPDADLSPWRGKTSVFWQLR